MAAHNFVLTRRGDTTGSLGPAFEFEHREQSTQIIHIKSDTGHLFFGALFNTAIRSSTGIAHAVEHLVGCGSRHYRQPHPFRSVIERFGNVYLNNFTAPDWTLYALSAPDHGSFYSALPIFLDGIFFPSMTEEAFVREVHNLPMGHSSKAEPVPDARGVVLNEVRGAASGMSFSMQRALSEILFPDLEYAFNHVGDAASVTTLNLDALRQFHQERYHPSQALLFIVGPVDVVGVLNMLEHDVLASFDTRFSRRSLERQTPLTSPVFEMRPYAGDSAQAPCALVAWAIDAFRSSGTVWQLRVLKRILLGDRTGHFRTVLARAGFRGVMTTGSGLMEEYRQPVFSCCFANSGRETAEQLTQAILDALENPYLLSSEKLIAAVDGVALDEQLMARQPLRGLQLLRRIATPWTLGADLLEHLNVDEQIFRLRKGQSSLSAMNAVIDTQLLTNSHRATISLQPVPVPASRQPERSRNHLGGVRQAYAKGLIDNALVGEYLLFPKETIVASQFDRPARKIVHSRPVFFAPRRSSELSAVQVDFDLSALDRSALVGLSSICKKFEELAGDIGSSIRSDAAFSARLCAGYQRVSSHLILAIECFTPKLDAILRRFGLLFSTCTASHFSFPSRPNMTQNRVLHSLPMLVRAAESFVAASAAIEAQVNGIGISVENSTAPSIRVLDRRRASVSIFSSCEIQYGDDSAVAQMLDAVPAGANDDGVAPVARPQNLYGGAVGVIANTGFTCSVMALAGQSRCREDAAVRAVLAGYMDAHLLTPSIRHRGRAYDVKAHYSWDHDTISMQCVENNEDGQIFAAFEECLVRIANGDVNTHAVSNTVLREQRVASELFRWKLRDESDDYTPGEKLKILEAIATVGKEDLVRAAQAICAEARCYAAAGPRDQLCALEQCLGVTFSLLTPPTGHEPS